MMSRSVQLVRRVLNTVLLVSIAAPALAQPNADTTRRTAPQTDLPLIPTRPLKFTNDEGTCAYPGRGRRHLRQHVVGGRHWRSEELDDDVTWLKSGRVGR